MPRNEAMGLLASPTCRVSRKSPHAETRVELDGDYKKMADDGILLGDAEPFDDLMQRCESLQ
jgi:hypothetical protein